VATASLVANPAGGRWPISGGIQGNGLHSPGPHPTAVCIPFPFNPPPRGLRYQDLPCRHLFFSTHTHTTVVSSGFMATTSRYIKTDYIIFTFLAKRLALHFFRTFSSTYFVWGKNSRVMKAPKVYFINSNFLWSNSTMIFTEQIL